MKSQSDLLASDISLCFDDILLIPEFSDLESRTVPSTQTQLGHLMFDAPIVSSPMDSITGLEMLVEMSKAGGLGILTRFINDPNEKTKQCDIIRKAYDAGARRVGCAIGIKNNVFEHAACLVDEGCNVICLDIAHGNHAKMYEAIEAVCKVKNHVNFSLMAGNVCTPEAALRFAEAGVDIIKVGIGPGAACTTRRVTGFGMPQLTAILRCASACANTKVQILADGGFRTTGDMIKALWAGADACMIGYMLAGTSATPDIDNGKSYRGMSSRTVHQRRDVAAEGVDMKVHYQGKTSVKLEEYKQGLKSGLAMAGARNIEALRHALCTQVSVFTMKESEPVV